MNFAPYQDDASDSTRTPSPRPSTSTAQPRNTTTASKPSTSTSSTPFYTDNANDDIEDETDFLPDPGDFEANVGEGRSSNNRGWNNNNSNNNNNNRGFLGFGSRNRRPVNVEQSDVDIFATSLPLKLNVLAVLCYVGLPPVAGAVLLVAETRSDYVRFHAWQSSLLFTLLFLIHLIFSFSKFISYTLLIVDVVLIAFLALHAYRDAETLERGEMPWIGKLASGFVDEE